MLNTAKVFTNGNSQAIRLPKAYRVNVGEMWISKNEVTGEITLTPKDNDERPSKFNLLFKMIEKTPLRKIFFRREMMRGRQIHLKMEDWVGQVQHQQQEQPTPS
jgi:antitoxin VapB